MMLFSRKTDYALLILSHLHHNPTGATARAIAEAFQLSKPFVANILKELCHKGFVTSHRGIKGGYTLQRPANSVHVGELFDALEDGFQVATCTNEMGEAETQPHDACGLQAVCPIRGPIRELQRRLMDVLKNMKLIELFPEEQTPTRRPLELPLLQLVETTQVVG